MGKYNYQLELIENVLKIYKTAKFENVQMFVFKYSNFLKVKNIIKNNENFNIENGIYIIKFDDGDPEIYAGITTKGLKRFNVHNHLKNFDYAEIFYFSFLSSNEDSKNLLEYIEKKLIKKINDSEIYKCKNSTNGIESKIGEYDLVVAKTRIESILHLLKIYNINFEKIEEFNNKNDENDENVFFIKKDNKYNGIIIHNQDDTWTLKKDSIIDNSKENQEIFKNLFEQNKNKIKDGKILENINWNSPSALCAIVKNNRCNGWIEMKNKNGKTPDEIYRK